MCVYCPPTAQFLSEHVTFKSASHTRGPHKHRASASTPQGNQPTHPPSTNATAASQPSAVVGFVLPPPNRRGNAAKLPHPRRVAASRLGGPPTAKPVCSRPSNREHRHSSHREPRRKTRNTAQRSAAECCFVSVISALFVCVRCPGRPHRRASQCGHRQWRPCRVGVIWRAAAAPCRSAVAVWPDRPHTVQCACRESDVSAQCEWGVSCRGVGIGVCVYVVILKFGRAIARMNGQRGLVYARAM